MSRHLHTSEPVLGCIQPVSKGIVWHSASTMARQLRTIASHMFSLDVRSLAAHRMALASTSIYALLVRFADLEAHYTDIGIETRWGVLKYRNYDEVGNWLFMPHFMTGNPAAVKIIFLIHFVALLFLFIGYKTKLAAILSWFLQISLTYRTLSVNNGSDVVLVFLHMFAMLLPLNEAWSLDLWVRLRKQENAYALRPAFAKRTKELTSNSSEEEANWSSLFGLAKFFRETSPSSSKSGPSFSVHNSVCSLGTAAFINQVCAIYLVASMHKLKSVRWSKTFDALKYSLNSDNISLYLGILLRESPDWLLRFLTKSSLWLELMSPVLLLTPVGILSRDLAVKIRVIAIIAYITFHFSIGVTMEVGNYSIVSSTMWIAFIPGDLWESSIVGCGRSRDPLASKSPARQRSGPKALYNNFLSKQSIFEKTLSAAIIYCTVSINVRNGYSAKFQKEYFSLGPLQVVADIFVLRQNWNMFGTFNKYDRWEEFIGTLQGDAKVDMLMFGGPVAPKPRFQAPEDYFNPTLIPQANFGKVRPNFYRPRFASFRWRKLMHFLIQQFESKKTDHFYQAYCKYVCRSWNGPGSVPDEDDPGQLVKVQLRFYAEPLFWNGTQSFNRSLKEVSCF